MYGELGHMTPELCELDSDSVSASACISASADVIQYLLMATVQILTDIGV